MTMMDVFMRLAQGRLEPEEWESWWGQHAEEVKKAVSPGDFLRIELTPGYRVDYWAMVKCQSGVRQYLDKLGIFYLRTGEYERLAREADERKKQNVEQVYREKIEPLAYIDATREGPPSMRSMTMFAPSCADITDSSPAGHKINFKTQATCSNYGRWPVCSATSSYPVQLFYNLSR